MDSNIVNLRGSIKAVLKNAETGDVVQEIHQNNIVVTAGRAWVLRQIASGQMATNQAISHLAIGTSTTAPATSQTALGSEVARKTVSFNTSGLTETTPWWRAEVTFATNEANTTLAEAGLFNSSSGGTMLARATFTTINKTTSNTLNISYTVSA